MSDKLFCRSRGALLECVMTTSRANDKPRAMGLIAHLRKKLSRTTSLSIPIKEATFARAPFAETTCFCLDGNEMQTRLQACRFAAP